MPPLVVGRCLHDGEIDRSGGRLVGSDWLAGVPIKRLATARRVQAQQPRRRRNHEKRVRNTPRRHGHPTSSDPVIGAVHVHDDLTVEDDHRLIGIRVGVQRRRLPAVHAVLEQQERTARFLRGRLPGVHTAAVEPTPFTVGGATDDRDWGAGRGDRHRNTLLMRPTSHDESPVSSRVCQSLTKPTGASNRSNEPAPR